MIVERGREFEAAGRAGTGLTRMIPHGYGTGYDLNYDFI